MVIAIDPGPEKSAMLIWHCGKVEVTRFLPNEDILGCMRNWNGNKTACVIEKVESFGMAVGAETFETVYWSGRFAEAYGAEKVERIGRRAVKIALCHSARATDANVRWAILDRFGGKDKAMGKKAAPGPLYGISGHLWAALALALTWEGQEALRAVGAI